MLDPYEREIYYMRIAVTDLCNLRCTYCMPPDGITKKSHAQILSYEEITAIAREAAAHGIWKIRLTGGEPLVKRDIADLVRMIAEVPGIRHIGMTTNGVLLKKMAAGLKQAGLNSINISLDTLNPQQYRKITRCGNIRYVLEGIEAAREIDLGPIKINMVVTNDTSNEDIAEMERFCLEKGLFMQLINHYELNEEKKDYYQFDRPPKCALCNRIRLTADGKLKPCLHTNTEIAVDMNEIAKCLRETVAAKPMRGTACTNRDMLHIGG